MPATARCSAAPSTRCCARATLTAGPPGRSSSMPATTHTRWAPGARIRRRTWRSCRGPGLLRLGGRDHSCPRRPTCASSWPAADGAVTVLKAKVPLKAGEIIDASAMSRKALRAFLAAQIDAAKRGGRAVLAAREDDHDEDLRSHHLRPRRVGVLRGCVREARRHAGAAGREPQQRPGRHAGAGRVPAGAREGGDQGRHRGRLCEAAAAGHGQLRPRHHQPACAQRRDHRRVDAGDDPRLRQACGGRTASCTTCSPPSRTGATRACTRP